MLQKAGIKTAIITSEDTEIVNSRAKKIGVDYVCQGVSDKNNVLNKLCRELRISPDEIAYIGDDINDLDILKRVGLSACPVDAMSQVKDVVQYVCKLKGGAGCVREIIEEIICKYA